MFILSPASHSANSMNITGPPKPGPGSNSLAFQKASRPLCFCREQYPLDLLQFSTIVSYLDTHRQAQLVASSGARAEMPSWWGNESKRIEITCRELMREAQAAANINEWKKMICLRKSMKPKWADHREEYSHTHRPCLTSDVLSKSSTCPAYGREHDLFPP